MSCDIYPTYERSLMYVPNGALLIINRRSDVRACLSRGEMATLSQVDEFYIKLVYFRLGSSISPKTNTRHVSIGCKTHLSLVKYTYSFLSISAEVHKIFSHGRSAVI